VTFHVPKQIAGLPSCDIRQFFARRDGRSAALISSALSGVYEAAVYCYAAEGETGALFTAEMVRGAFRKKK
jgi:hypothetical protein